MPPLGIRQNIDDQSGKFMGIEPGQLLTTLLKEDQAYVSAPSAISTQPVVRGPPISGITAQYINDFIDLKA